MNGRIKMYNENRGFGFIYGDDGRDYYFHVSAARSVETLFRGRQVTFTPSEAKEGRIATEIICPESREAPETVLLGGLRVRLQAIEVYGIVWEEGVEILRVACKGGERLRFSQTEAPFDIYEKCAELDSYLLSIR